MVIGRTWKSRTAPRCRHLSTIRLGRGGRHKIISQTLQRSQTDQVVRWEDALSLGEQQRLGMARMFQGTSRKFAGHCFSITFFKVALLVFVLLALIVLRALPWTLLILLVLLIKLRVAFMAALRALRSRSMLRSSCTELPFKLASPASPFPRS